jgi:AcrR family transcriptional regulator
MPRVSAPRSDGARSRELILAEAARLATVEGIDGLSLGRLAEAVGMSKSGLFAHFGSKEELQLATIEAATDVFERHVLAPAATAATPLERLHVLTDGYLAYISDEVFPGGCFFSSALTEVDMQPGPVRDRLVKFLIDWLALLDKTIVEAQDAGQLDPSEEPAQLSFELEAFLFSANTQYVVVRTQEPIERARRAITRRIDAVTL